MFIDTTLDLAPVTIVNGETVVDVDNGSTVRVRGFLPPLYLRGGVDFSKLIELFVEGDGMYTSSDNFYDVVAKSRFRINRKWDLALGWRTVVSDLEVQDLKNDFKRSGGLLHVAYSF